MGAADIVPGVSGGTVALVVGIYERLIANVHTGARALGELARGRPRRALDRLGEIEWGFILPLLAGIAVAVLGLAAVLERALAEQPVRMGGLFFGLVAGAAVGSLRLIRDPRPGPQLATGLAVAVATFLLLGLRSSTEAEGAATAVAPLWAYPLGGAVAICAMILPGISGSFILLLLGLYEDVLGAVNQRDVLALGVFLAGAVVGLAAFSTLLKAALDRAHDLVLAAMIGLMVGSLRVLWPWPGGTATTELAPPRGDVLVPVLLAVAGFALVVVVTLVGERAGREPVPAG